MNDHGSGQGTGKGSRLRQSTQARNRRESTPAWGQTYTYASGGSVTIPTSRRVEATTKNARKVLAKELSMSRVFAQTGGDKIEFTAHGAGNHDIFANGIRAELKRISSHNNILREARDAVKNQGAKRVYFEFTRDTPKIREKIFELQRKRYKGRYFFSNNKKQIYDL